jgi:beta-galactosidase
LIHLDGTITERARTAGEVARLVDRNQRLFLEARPPAAQVAVVYNPMAHFVGGRQRTAAYGGPQGEVVGIERDSLLGVYRALFPRNVPIDYVHIRELSADALKPYKLLVLPYPLLLPEASAAALKGYVQNGGALVAEARLGWSNERGNASDRIPGMGLWEVMGCRETDVQTGPRGRTEIRWTVSDLLKPGDTLPARWYEETLEPLSPNARVVGTFADGRPAAVMSTFGKGKTLMLGSYVSAAYESTPTPAVERFYSALLDWAGVTPPLKATGTRIEARMLETPTGPLVFVFNHNGQATETSLTLPPGAATDLTSGQRVTSLTKTLAPNEVWVLKVAK